MANQIPWKMALTDTTSKDSSTSEESSASSNINSSISFNSLEGSYYPKRNSSSSISSFYIFASVTLETWTKKFKKWSQIVRLILEGKGKFISFIGEMKKLINGDPTLKT